MSSLQQTDCVVKLTLTTEQKNTWRLSVGSPLSLTFSFLTLQKAEPVTAYCHTLQPQTLGSKPVKEKWQKLSEKDFCVIGWNLLLISKSPWDNAAQPPQRHQHKAFKGDKFVPLTLHVHFEEFETNEKKIRAALQKDARDSKPALPKWPLFISYLFFYLYFGKFGILFA